MSALGFETRSAQPEVGGAWRRWRGIVALGVVVVAVVLLLSLFTPRTSEEALAPDSVSPSGARALARVLQAQRGSDDDHLAHAPEALGLEDHPAQAGVDREAGEAATDVGEPDAGSGRHTVGATTCPVRMTLRGRLGGHRAELLEQVGAGLDVAAVGRLHEGEAGDVGSGGRRQPCRR